MAKQNTSTKLNILATAHTSGITKKEELEFDLDFHSKNNVPIPTLNTDD